MSSTDSDTNLSSLESSTCRILTVSSSLRCAIDLVDRIRDASSNAETQQSGLGESTRIPWTISNKYYSADVHFQAHTVIGLSPHLVRNVPAVIYVWSKGEAYKHHVERLAGDMSGYEPEVSLAVRVAPSTSAPSDLEDEHQDDPDIDEFLSSNGFEFIDASEEQSNAEDDSATFADGIPGLPRVVDALSTIMWPSMQTRSRPKTARLHQDFDWAHASQDDMSPFPKQEMEELARWLEEDDTSDDPWRPAGDSISASPTNLDATEFPEGAKEFGFEDDFTVFVSAPPVEKDEDEEQDDDFNDDQSPTGLGSSPLYLSLGSALDLREVETDKPGNDNDNPSDDDPDMPTEAEIEETSARIFGGADSEDYDLAAFDLSRVMSALEGMKAEIASMEDEGEKRKAAASVAISLVYGLQGNNGS